MGIKEKVIEKVKGFYNDAKNSEIVRNAQNKIFDDEDYSIKTDILNKIKEYETIIIHRHARPDGDALGSSLGLREILRDNFPEKNIYSVGEKVPEYLNFLGSEDEVIDEVYENALVIVVDTATKARICDERYQKAKELIKIDHHDPVESYGNINYVKEHIASCSLVIMDIFSAFPNMIISDKAARYLYIATVTDTGRFRYSDVDGKAMKLAGEMLEKGINTEEIYANLYTKSLESYQLQAYVYKNIKRTENGVAYMFMTKKIMKKFKVSIEDASNMVNLMDGIRGSMIWILFIEHPENIRVRLRSRHMKVIDIAKLYDGGGHDNASGATLKNKKQIPQLLKEADIRLKQFKLENEDKF